MLLCLTFKKSKERKKMLQHVVSRLNDMKINKEKNA